MIDKLSGMLLYVSVQKPVRAYVKPGADPKPDEWKASVVLTDEDEVDALEEYAKELDTQLSIKKVKKDAFEETYKCAPPEDAGKNVWVVTFRKSVMLGKTDKPVPEQYKPRVFQRKGNQTVEITNTNLVGNGSYGSISLDRFDRAAGGSSLYLKNVLVTDLVEYEESNSYVPGSEFGDAPAATKESKPESKPAAKKPAAKQASKPKVDEELDDDIPF